MLIGANSATGGFLQPVGFPQQPEDQALEDFLWQFAFALSGLARGGLARPLWQQETEDGAVPTPPEVDVDWLAFGPVDYQPDTYAVETHLPVIDGVPQGTQLDRHEFITVRLIFYGPNSSARCREFRDGLQVSQNRELLTVNGMGLVDTGRAVNATELVKNRYRRRIDMPWTIKRHVRQVYPVLTILSFNGTILTDGTPQLVVPVQANPLPQGN